MPPLIDIVGQKYNRLTVIKKDANNHGYWICKCDCGTIKSVQGYHLKSGNTKSCGCFNNELIHETKRNYIDLSGSKYGYLEVLEYVSSSKNGTRWKCLCHYCNEITTVTASYLKKYKSCGCIMRKEGNKNISSYIQDVVDFGTAPGIIKRTDANVNNKLGIKGVWYNEKKKHYVAYISFKGNRYTLLKSSDLQSCVDARRQAEIYFHKNFLEWYEQYKQEKKNGNK